jgi:uncharacterized protein involved in response to NO
MATIQLEEPVFRPKGGPVFFAAGFRPFFLFAAIEAAVMIPLWLAVQSGMVDLGTGFPPMLWHGHEMLFGFAGAAVGGFLLTAVPNWTDGRILGGPRLMALFAAWVLGRVAFLLAGILPPVAVAVADLLYLPGLAFLLAEQLIGARKWRNIAFLPVLGVLWASDIAFHLGEGLAALHAGITVVLVMIAIVGGRVVPSFTETWLRMKGTIVTPRRLPWIEKGGAAVSIVVAGLVMVVAPGSPYAGIALLAAAGVHGLRLSGWHGAKTFSNPILWVLHVGYGWMVVGLALWGLSCLLPVLPQTAALHALTAGSIATMVMGVMSRAALGHSGRSLDVPPLIVAAYILVSVGALLRVVGLTMIGGSVWSLAWVFFVIIYWPIVTRPRADGRPG